MSYSWENCPQLIKDQMLNIVSAIQSALGKNLVGVYLHGSLALGCFNPNTSDYDLLVVVRDALSDTEKLELTHLCFNHSCLPIPLEITVMAQRQLDKWTHPSPFEFHFSEELRGNFVEMVASNIYSNVNFAETDPNLAAHITMVLKRGVTLFGKPADDVLHSVPRADYVSALLTDFNRAKQQLQEKPMYFILNACRIHAFLSEGKILSKSEGATWAMDHYPEKYHQVISQAMNNYLGKLKIDISGHDIAELAYFYFIDTKFPTK